ncbi:MAG: ABC transporter ATP-binding protein/permease [Acidimicrobiia bacterium]|nr:ABC transporter ATP-binding protein/permease [Acidimicrobiia bacterium]
MSRFRADDRRVQPSDAWRLIREQIALHPGPFAISVFGAVLYAGATVVSAEVLGYVTDSVIYPSYVADGPTPDPVLWGAAAIVAVVALRSAGVVARRYFAGMTAERVQATFRRTLTDRYLRLPISWHQRMPTGQLLAHADNDTEKMAEVLHPLPFSLGTFFLAAFSAVSLLLVDVVLAAVAFSVFPALILLNRVYSSRVERPAAAAQEEVGRTSAIAHESFDGALIVKTLGRADAEVERFGVAAHRLREHRVEIGYIRALFEAVLDMLPNIGIVLVIVVGALRVDAGAVTRGDLVQVAALFTVLAFPMRVLGFFLETVPPSVVSRQRLNLVLDEQLPAPVPSSGVLPEGPLAVRASAVGYQYDDDVEVLTGIDFTIEPGEIVALVGSTGAGKSTLCSLVAGLMPPSVGSITLGGVELADLSDRERTDAVALVFQETFLFGASVTGNIDLDGAYTADEIREAAAVARAAGFIDRLPNGFDTVLGERGVTLSGGQRQRVALARALVRKPRLLILDDATSAVDPKIEQEILARLRSRLHTTTLVVAQRVATIGLADRVLFLADGRIAAAGTHDELMTNADYRALVMAYELAGT